MAYNAGISSACESNREKAVIHCIEIMGLKNSERITKTENGGYIHINARGRKRLFTPYTCKEYFDKYYAENFGSKKLHKVMIYYITEEKK